MFACISSVSTISFWDDSKVSGTKSRNKTIRGYSGIPGDDMRSPILKGNLKPHVGRIGRAAAASPMRRRLRAVRRARGAASSPAEICVRINDVYQASRIVLFWRRSPHGGVNPRMGFFSRVFRGA
ncbi:hypothetical protein EVC45_21230 [Paraburkholderia sp. UYCP14C]|nr:hypothetical protein EVC45_21230 [Paraburkholderia sp. UYCP14C]